jgi:hypothetical protein
MIETVPTYVQTQEKVCSSFFGNEELDSSHGHAHYFHDTWTLNTGGGSVNLPKLIGRSGSFLPHLLSLPCRCPCRKYHHWTWDVTGQSNMAAGLQLWQVLWYFGSLYQMLYNTVTRSVCWAHTVFIRASSKWLMLPEVKTNQFACTRAPEADRHVNQAEARSAISAIKYNVRMDTNAVWIWVCTISETAPRLLYGEPPECHKRSLSAILIYFNLKCISLCSQITWPTSEVLLSDCWNLEHSTYGGHIGSCVSQVHPFHRVKTLWSHSSRSNESMIQWCNCVLMLHFSIN